MNKESRFRLNDKAYIASDNGGWYHGVGDGREVEIKDITPLPEIDTYEYEVMDNNGDFWHVPESDLSLFQSGIAIKKEG